MTLIIINYNKVLLERLCKMDLCLMGTPAFNGER